MEVSKAFFDSLTGTKNTVGSIYDMYVISLIERVVTFSNVVIRYPDTTVKIVKARKSKDLILINWCLWFATMSKDDLTQHARVMIQFANQEINLDKRNPMYFNPYWNNEQADADNFVHNFRNIMEFNRYQNEIRRRESGNESDSSLPPVEITLDEKRRLDL